MHTRPFKLRMQQKMKLANAGKNTDFYTAGGLHVYFKDDFFNEDIDVEEVVDKVESVLAPHLLDEVDMIIFGHFDEFEERSINAFYDNGALYVSNVQHDFDDLYDDLIHEISHSLEPAHGWEIYGDQKVKEEFLRKRKYMHDILWKSGFKAPESFFTNIDYDKEFDMFLYEDVGYNNLSELLVGLFINPYAATSLREYFATGFTDFYLHSNHATLQKVSPELYKKLLVLQDPKKLDSAS